MTRTFRCRTSGAEQPSQTFSFLGSLKSVWHVRFTSESRHSPARFGRTLCACRFRKLHPLDSRSPANQNMIAGCSLLPSFSSACCATVSSRDDGLKPKSWCCGIFGDCRDVGVWPARFGAILYVRIFFRRGLLDFLDREHRVRVSAAGTHLRSDPDRFHNLFSRCTMSQGGFSVATYAVGTLRDMGDGDSDWLLRFGRQSTIGKYLHAEGLKGFVDPRSEPLTRVGRRL